MSFFKLSFAACAVLAASPILAQPVADGASQPTGVAAMAEKKKEKKTCRTVETSTSRMRPRVCKTASEWAMDAQRASNGQLATGANGNQIGGQNDPADRPAPD